MNIAIIGGRDFSDFSILEEFVLSHINDRVLFESKIISGKAKGADSLGEEFAKKYKLEVVEFPADWAKFGRAAGMIRNKDIIKNADIVFAFWDGESKGTKNGIDLAIKNKKPLHVCKYEKYIENGEVKTKLK